MTNAVVCILLAGLLLYFGLCWFDPWDIDPWKRGRRKKPADPIIDPNARCPACGARDGAINAYGKNRVFEESAGKYSQSQTVRELWINHACHVCLYNWDELPLFRQDETESSL